MCLPRMGMLRSTEVKVEWGFFFRMLDGKSQIPNLRIANGGFFMCITTTNIIFVNSLGF